MKRPASAPTASASFFESADAFRTWLAEGHLTHSELWVGFHRKGTGTVGLDYTTAVEVALCFGWIDGVRKKLGETTYANRFTPRKPGSAWSRANIARVERLKAAGQMHAAGLDAYARQGVPESGAHALERRPETLPPELERRFRQSPRAWTHFLAEPPGYRRLAIAWVSSAKRHETRLRRLTQLIHACRQHRRLGILQGKTGTLATRTGTVSPRR